MARVITFGEIMMRLNPEGYLRFVQADKFEATYAGGDSFGGGLIYALLSGRNDQQVIDFAVAASCLKHSVEHDFNQMSVAEVEALAAGNASGRVQR